jgi:EAL domain-containing protein (putative c-di-GMP-specific phosphodiesterase class I)
MSRDRNDATIVRTVIEMGHNLGFTVIAEGVETEEQATLLQQLGCEHAQGYLFGHPMPAEELVRLYVALPAIQPSSHLQPRRRKTVTSSVRRASPEVR